MSPTQQGRKDFHTCLDCAIEIMDLIESGGKAVSMGPLRGREVDIKSVIEAIKLHHPIELPEEKVHELGEDIAHSLAHYGITGCAMWSIAHSLDHLLFDSEAVTQH